MSLPADADAGKAQLARYLDSEVRPALQREGVEIELLDGSDGVVRVRLHGSCSGCPSAILAIIMGIEQEMRQQLPGVVYLEVVP